MSESVTARPWPSLAAETSIWTGAAACVAGFVAHRLWTELPAGRLGESLLLAGLASALAWPLVRWRRLPQASALVLVWLLALAVQWGPLPMLATALLAIAAAAVGATIVGDRQPALAVACGLALIAGVGGWFLPLPVHRAWTWGPLLLALVAWRRRSLYLQLDTALTTWREAVASAPAAARWTLLLLGLASTGAWLPTMQFDDLAYHLGLPWQLMEHGRYALDPSHQVWALAPWAGDVLQAVAQLLARQESRGPLNAVWLLLTAAGLWRLGRWLGLSAALRWGGIALFASLPLTAALLGGMQTETAATATMALLAVAVVDDSPVRGRLWAGAVLFGLLFALKSLHGLAALPLLMLAFWRHRKTAGGRRRWPLALLAAAAIALSSYAYAWWIAGNPVLPLFNGVFESPYFPARDFIDRRWLAGFDAALAWNLTFQTKQYLEAWNGGIGFVLVALSGAVPLTLVDARARPLLLCALAAMIVPLAPMQYARYAHPALVLALPALLAGMRRFVPWQRSRWLLAGLCLLNLAFQANAQWLLHAGTVKRSVAALGQDTALFDRYAPERLIAAMIRTQAPESGPVLVLSHTTPAYAELGTRARTTTWYDPRLEAARVAAEADGSGRAWARLFRDEGIAELIVRPAELSDAQRRGLEVAGANREAAVGNAEWWRVPHEARQ